MFKSRLMDITMRTQYMTCHVRLSRFNSKFEEAQVWLDREVMKKMEPVIPRKTGEFLSKIKTANEALAGTGRVQTTVPPQGRYLYPGIAPSGRPFNWTNPQTQPYWGRYVRINYKPELMEGVREILMRGEGGNG